MGQPPVLPCNGDGFREIDSNDQRGMVLRNCAPVRIGRQHVRRLVENYRQAKSGWSRASFRAPLLLKRYRRFH